MIIKKIIFRPFKTKKIFLLLLNTLLLIQTRAYTSFELRGSGARIHAMGQAYVGLSNTPDAIFINCSGLAQIPYPSLSASYTRPFGLKELTIGSVTTVIPTALGNLAMGFTNFGSDIYREQSLTTSFNRSVKGKFYYGFNLHYMKLQISNYGSDFCFELDLGFLMKILPNLSWGFMATNLNRATLGQAGDNLPQTFNTGLSIYPINNLTLNLDMFKDSMFPLELRCGIEYLLFNRVAIRSGFSTEPSRFCAGFGFLFSHLEIDYAITTHKDLGLTHYFSLQLLLNHRKNRIISENINYKLRPVKITKININTATIENLQKIPGIGPTLAQRIVAYRQQIGKFISLEQLQQVKGIGKNKFESIKPYITIVE